MHRKHGSESVCKTESFESFFVGEMTPAPWTKVCHFSPSVSSHRQKMTQMTQFCILTHSDVADGWVIFFLLESVEVFFSYSG